MVGFGAVTVITEIIVPVDAASTTQLFFANDDAASEKAMISVGQTNVKSSG